MKYARTSAILPWRKAYHFSSIHESVPAARRMPDSEAQTLDLEQCQASRNVRFRAIEAREPRGRSRPIAVYPRRSYRHLADVRNTSLTPHHRNPWALWVVVATRSLHLGLLPARSAGKRVQPRNVTTR